MQLISKFHLVTISCTTLQTSKRAELWFSQLFFIKAPESYVIIDYSYTVLFAFSKDVRILGYYFQKHRKNKAEQIKNEENIQKHGFINTKSSSEIQIG